MAEIQSKSQSPEPVSGAVPGTVATAAAPPAAPVRRVGGGLLDPKMLWKSLPDAVKKLDPRVQIRNPVMFVVEVGSVLTTYSAIIHTSIFAWTITVWLWLTVLFATLLIGVIIILVGLTYFPALALGPFAEGLH